MYIYIYVYIYIDIYIYIFICHACSENRGKTCYLGRKQQAFTHSVGQTRKGSRAKWIASQKSNEFVQRVVLPHIRGQLPANWAGVERKLTHCSTSQYLLLAGDLGCYILQFYDMDMHFKNLFARLYRAMESLMRKGYSNASLNTVEEELHAALAAAETMLPLMWCTGVRHYLLHAVTYIRRCGPFFEHNMLGFERWHVMFKRLARGRRNLVASVHNHWSEYILHVLFLMRF